MDQRTEQARVYLEALERELADLGETLDARANGRVTPGGARSGGRGSRPRRIAIYALVAGTAIAASAALGFAAGRLGAREPVPTQVEVDSLRAKLAASRAEARVEEMDGRLGHLESTVEGLAAARHAPDVPSSPTDGQGIRQTSDTTWEIDRAFVDRALAAAPMLRANRVIPHQDNGRTIGVKIYGIRRDSTLGRLGIQNGDLLVAVNGLEIVTPDAALEAYTRLRETDAVFLELVRRGEPRVHAYRLVR